MDDFWFNVKYGFKHVLDINGYDHVLFIILLAIPYLFKDYKRVLLLVSFFTLGHTISLMLAFYSYIEPNIAWVEFLIIVTIFFSGIYNIVMAQKETTQTKFSWLMMSALVFGLIHGCGFAREFKMFSAMLDNKFRALIEFAIGIELAQIIVVIVVLILSFLFREVLKLKKHYWVTVISAIIVLLTIPELYNRWPL